jgi:CRP/FNR family transcriptional regulator, cyclic AMP receptor protein
MGIASSPQDSVAIEAPGLLPEDLAVELIARSRQQRIKQGQIVIAEGTPSDDVFYIVSGKVQVSVLSLGGWETIFRDMGAGELVGELAAIDGDERSASVVALEDSQLAALTAPQFRRFLSEVPKAGYWMALQLTERVRNLSARAFEMATLPVSGRLIAELLRLPAADRQGQRTIASLPTHAELAARIGTHRETVTRELRALCKLGLIAQRGRTLIIASAEALDHHMQSMRR